MIKLINRVLVSFIFIEKFEKLSNVADYDKSYSIFEKDLLLFGINN
jgi:hypothetical protein